VSQFDILRILAGLSEIPSVAEVWATSSTSFGSSLFTERAEGQNLIFGVTSAGRHAVTHNFIEGQEAC
jgi:hypothetical protein